MVDGLTEEAALTLKRIYWEGDQVCLRPANPAHEPLYYPKANIRSAVWRPNGSTAAPSDSASDCRSYGPSHGTVSDLTRPQRSVC